MKSNLYLMLGLLALGALALWVWRTAHEAVEPPPRLVQDMTLPPERPRMAPPAGAVPFGTPTALPSESSGEALFLLHCAACHGPGGNGQSYVAQQPGMPDVSDLTATDTPAEELYHTLTEGRGAMPAFGARLSENKRRLLLQYILTLHRP